jgi:hypothetical protein
MKASETSDNYAELVAGIFHGPKTNTQLQELTGLHHQTIARFMHGLRQRGVAECKNGTRRAGQMGNVPFEWVMVKK